MSAPYLIEIRTGGEIKNTLRNIIYEVAEEFGVQGAAAPRAVPHITLFGPYNTNQGQRVKDRIISVLKDFDVVPYRVSGFDHFRDSNVIYAKVIPSAEFRKMRRELYRNLKDITYNRRPHDEKYFYDFHITIAFKDVGRQFGEVWDFVNDQYEIEFDEYATRVTNLNRRDMMWEYDLLQQSVLSRSEATSAESWDQTNELLEEMTGEDDHSNLSEKPGKIRQYMALTKAKINSEW